MPLKILFIYLRLFTKYFEKEFPKKTLQNKTSGASVVQNFKLEKSHPCISRRNNYWFHSKQPLHLHYAKLVQFCTFIFALVCVGINHQKGEIEREIGLHLFLIDFGG
jgi:hypothetical protein